MTRTFCSALISLVSLALGINAIAPASAHAQSVVWVQRVASPSPSPRVQSAMAYDSLRNVSVLFGGTRTGSPNGTNGETWEWNGVRWMLVANSGPTPRRKHAMVYDAARRVAVLFGGVAGTANSGETWEWDAAAAGPGGVGGWSQRAVPGPSARSSHAMAYDSTRGVTVLFGGISNVPLGDTWEFNGTAWALRASTGPSPRSGAAMGYDSARGVTVLYGGRFGDIFYGDTWEWNGASWTLRAPGNVTLPTGREGHTLAYDSIRGVTVLFGGSNELGAQGDTWEWNGSGAWVQRPLAGGIPPYSAHVMAYDAVRRQTLLLGASSGLTTSDTWVLETVGGCGDADFNGDGDVGTDADIEAFFACLAGNCCATCGSADFNGDGDIGTDADIEAFFRVLAGGTC